MAAPEGNKYALGNDGGRPPIHTDPEKVGFLVHDYFLWIEGEFKETKEKITDEDGNEKTEIIREWVRRPEPPTVNGLTLHLGFSHKSSLYDYAEKEEFSDPIKKGLTRIEKFHEIQTAKGDKCTGNIFVLKNFGWKDSVHKEINTKQEIVWHEERTYETDPKAD